MATSSITKGFVIMDPDVFDKLLKALESQPPRSLKAVNGLSVTNGSVLDKGREALKRFVPRSEN